MIIPKDSEKNGNIQHLFLKKSSQKTIIEGKFLYLIKIMYKPKVYVNLKLTSNLIVTHWLISPKEEGQGRDFYSHHSYSTLYLWQ